MDQITIDRIKKMHPKLRCELLDQYLHANNKLLPEGVRLRFAYTLRTIAEQDALYSQGRTKPGKIVTNAKGGQSMHNYGLAFDIVILFDKYGDGKFETASYAIDKHWMAVTKYFKSKGWEWGGDWDRFKDAPHFQKAFGMNVVKLRGLKKDAEGYPIF